MSRQVLINAVLKSVEGNNKVNLTQAAAGNIVSAVTEAITAGLRESGAFAIHGFGTFRTAYVRLDSFTLLAGLVQDHRGAIFLGPRLDAFSCPFSLLQNRSANCQLSSV